MFFDIHVVYSLDVSNLLFNSEHKMVEKISLPLYTHQCYALPCRHIYTRVLYCRVRAPLHAFRQNHRAEATGTIVSNTMPKPEH